MPGDILDNANIGWMSLQGEILAGFVGPKKAKQTYLGPSVQKSNGAKDMATRTVATLRF